MGGGAVGRYEKGRFIESGHFAEGVPPGTARRIFKASVATVELETFSYCNRRCWFCANAYIDRRSTNTFLDEAVFAMVLRDLASIDFDGIVNLSAYNEPLADRAIVDHIRRVRRSLPRAAISLYSNGDYLDVGLLARLRRAGLDEMYLSIHTGDREEFDDGRVLRRIDSLARRIGAKIVVTTAKPGLLYKARVKLRGLRIRLYEPNMRELGANMGELVSGVPQDFRRASPCLAPFTNFCVNYTGHVVPCCRIRSDAAAHRDFVVCDLREHETIFDAYTHSRLAAWRRAVCRFGDKEAPCRSCDNALIPDTPRLRRRYAAIAAMTGGGPTGQAEARGGARMPIPE